MHATHVLNAKRSDLRK